MNPLLPYAIEYASHGWPVFPLRGKNPAIRNPHPPGSRERQECKGECGRDGHGVWDASTDIAVVAAWWTHNPYANIGGRIPESMMMIDVDPYHGGLTTLAALIAENGPLPPTLVDLSGRGDGGVHFWFRRPPGKLTGVRLGAGIDLKTSTGYAVLPPSIHPVTGRPYIRIERAVAAPPEWLMKLLAPAPPTIRPARPTSLWLSSVWGASSIADDYSANSSWTDILEPHGWRCRDGHPDADGARWLHPAATSQCSASVRHQCLFVWSTNTPFEISEPSYPKGYTRFRAYAVLNHNGDLSAAARALKGSR